MITLRYNDRTIRIKPVSPTSKETVWYEDEIVSQRHSLTGATHRFTVDEFGMEVDYEVKIRTSWNSLGVLVQVRRNDKLILEVK